MTARSHFWHGKFGEAGGINLSALLILLGASMLLAFIGIADETAEGDTLRFDQNILVCVRAMLVHHPYIARTVIPAMQDISSLGGVAVVIMLLLGAAGYLVLKHKYRTLVFLFCCTAGGAALMNILKFMFHRPRPDVVQHLTDITQTSFPSGHSMVSAIVYLTLAALLARSTTDRSLRIYFLCVAVVISVLVGVSRIILGVHYPTDVVAGWSVGVAWAALCYLISDVLSRRRTVEPPTKS